MGMPGPNDAHKKLARLAGKWRGDEKMYPSQWDPQGGIAQATMNNHVGVDGFVLIGDYEQSRNGAVSFRGHAVHTVDPKSGDNVMYWFDSMGQGADLFRGTFDGDTMVVTQDSAMGLVRMTYRLEGENRLHSKMEMSPDGKDWKILFEGEYTK